MVKSAVAMEKLIVEKLSSTVPYIILRFGILYSEDSFHTQNLISDVKSRKMPVIGKGENILNFIHTEDAASAVVYTLNCWTRLSNSIINFSDFKPVTSIELIELLYLKAKSPIRIPKLLARLILGKDVYEIATNSYRLIKSDRIPDWSPKYSSFLMWTKSHHNNTLNEKVYQQLN